MRSRASAAVLVWLSVTLLAASFVVLHVVAGAAVFSFAGGPIGSAGHSTRAESTLLLPKAARSPGAALVRRLDGARPGNPPGEPFVEIDAVASVDIETLRSHLDALGLVHAENHGRLVSGMLPRKSLAQLAGLPSLQDVREGTVRFLSGSVTSEGDRAIRADIAREAAGQSGRGVTVGVISDSYDCLGGAMADQASGDLPRVVRVLREADDCTEKVDEGRALMQIVHDIAPDATLVFRSGSGGTAGVANAVLELAFTAGADVIVDDAVSPSATFFQDNAVARAVRRVEAAGVVYVTAAGNDGRNSYESMYREHYMPRLALRAHDFDPGPGVDTLQPFEVPEGEAMPLILQWDDPAFSNSGAPGARTDLDLIVVDEAGTEVLARAATDNIGRDPIEFLNFFNPPGSGTTRFQLLIVTAAGPSAGRVKYVVQGRFAGRFLAYETASGTIVGHANTEAALTVGAADHLLTPRYGVAAPILRSFSSAGGTPLLFDDDGRRYVEPLRRRKPDIVAPDAVSTTFFGENDRDGDGLPEFLGTSAAAPHVAGAVALLLEARPSLSPADVRIVITRSATDIRARSVVASPGTAVDPGGGGDEVDTTTIGDGVDDDSGYGLVDAAAAVASLARFVPEVPAEVSPPATQDADVSVRTGKLSVASILGLLFVLAWARLSRGQATRLSCRRSLSGTP